MSERRNKRFQLLFLGIALLGFALSIPIYLRALDDEVIRFAGRDSSRIEEMVRHNLLIEKPGISEMLLQGARQCGVKRLDDSQKALDAYWLKHPELAFWGGAFAEFEMMNDSNDHDDQTDQDDHKDQNDSDDHTHLLAGLLHQPIRDALLNRLHDSRRPGVQAILENRLISHTEIFPPVSRPGGVILDSMITATALLSQGDYLKKSLREEIEGLADKANRGNPTAALESFYLDVLAFSKRLNWAQFSGLMGRIEDRRSLRRLAHTIEKDDDDLPRLFAFCWIAPVHKLSDYLDRFPETAFTDLSFGITCHQAGLESILDRQERVYHSNFRSHLRRLLPFEKLWNGISQFAFHFAWLAIFVKYIAILIGSFCIIRFFENLISSRFKSQRSQASESIEATILIRQQIFSMCILSIFILMGEPFLAQNDQQEETSPNWKFRATFANLNKESNVMIGENVSEMTILVIVFFFLTQAALYVLGLVKLKEIKSVKCSPQLKLKLLDNEENMFDAGLYVGLGGTILSLLVITLNLAEVGLMAAYASTLFGIVFVGFLKIFHVRPTRRRFLIESESSIL